MAAPAEVPAPTWPGGFEVAQLTRLAQVLRETVRGPRRLRLVSAAAMRSSRLDTDEDQPARPRPGTARPSAPAHHPSPRPTRQPADDEPPAGMDAAHAETWRLVQRAQGGDGEAFGQLYDRYFDVVYRFVYFRVNDRTLAEDVTSETFLRALRRITTINYQGRDIGAWFVTIARNIVLDHLKSARHRLESPTADTIERPDTAPSTETAVLASLESQRLLQAIAKLGDEQRECLVLRFIQGMSVSETAEIMGKKDGAIKALQHRAVRKLAELVGPDPA